MKKPLPDEFVHALKLATTTDGDALIRALDDEAPVSIRVNPRKKNEWGSPKPVPWCADGYYLPERPVFTRDPIFHAGGYYVQEASSMFLEQILKHAQLETACALDLCAAPGGKSTQLASLMGDAGLLVCNEAIRNRCGMLLENLTKWGHGNTIITHNDPADFNRLPGFFDLVMVDAPCSGEGMFRKDPEAREHWSRSHVVHCAQRQARILEAVWPALKSEGMLIYSTCTFNETENERQLLALQQHHDFDSVRIPIDPQWHIVETRVNGIYGYRFFPGLVQGEGFFVSVLRKTDAALTPHMTGGGKNSNPRFNPAKKIQMPWLEDSFPCEWLSFRDQVVVVPQNRIREIEMIASCLTVLRTGTHVGMIKQNKIVPEHDLAMSVHVSSSIPRIELDHEQALQYLRKEGLDHLPGSKGFHLVTYLQQPLGWVNHLGNRFNNLYPSEWRIRLRS